MKRTATLMTAAETRQALVIFHSWLSLNASGSLYENKLVSLLILSDS